MKKYDSYKDSGIEWIGEIPSHWEVKRLKYVSTINDDTLSEKTEDDYKVEYVDISSIESGVGISRTEKFTFKEAPSRARRVVIDGDIIVSTVRTYLKAIAKIKNPKPNMVVSTGFAVVRPRDIIPDYAGHLFYHENLLGEIVSRSVGVSYPAINSSEIGTIKIPLPEKTEQTAIAAYLDRKTAEIDELIADKKRLLELYEEEKTAIINQAVTKGINPDAPMKDSGIEWLGEIPEHWEVRKINPFVLIKRGAGYQYIEEVFDEKEDFEYVIRISDFNNYDPIKALALEGFNKYRVYENDILIAGTGESAGITLFVDKKMDGMVHSYNALRISVNNQDELDSKFLYYHLQSHSILEQMNLAFTGSAQHFLDVQRISNFLITMPPIEEQNALVEFIEGQTHLLLYKINKTEELLRLLTEYRSSLISEIVTGKIKVID